MQQSFEYLKVQTAMDSITVENIGNVILQATNDLGFEWYIQICTDVGLSNIKEFGPLFKESEVSKLGFIYSQEKKEYNEKYISKRISSFLNSPSREITQVQVIDEFELEDKLSQVRNLI